MKPTWIVWSGALCVLWMGCLDSEDPADPEPMVSTSPTVSPPGSQGGNTQPAEDCEGAVGCACYPNATCDGELECTGGRCLVGGDCVGEERCACYPNQTCNASLACRAGVCVSDGGGGDQPAAGASGGDTMTMDAGTGTTMTAGGPVFLSFATNNTTIRDDETLVFSAVLTDPDGVDDLIGGTLIDPTTGGTYGSFATEASEGSYTLSLAWGAIHTVSPIYIDPRGVDRVFRAEFFDVGGNRASQDLTVHLRCDGDTEGTCDNGVCRNFLSYTTCGSCEVACDWSCENYACVDTIPSATPVSCAALCASESLQCFDDNDPGYVWYDSVADSWTVDTSCSQVPSSTDLDGTFSSQSCRCSEARPAWVSEL